MPRDADLFEAAHGDPLEGSLLLKRSGGNIIAELREWSEAFRKECFYYGIRVLFELERKGKTNM